jgi:hypothetical protein
MHRPYGQVSLKPGHYGVTAAPGAEARMRIAVSEGRHAEFVPLAEVKNKNMPYTHFPGLPDTLGSALLLSAIYLTPGCLMALGTVAIARTGSRAVFEVSLWMAGLLTLAMLLVSGSAHVDYAGCC